MIDRIRAFFDRAMVPEPEVAPEQNDSGHHPVHVAACALLLELAHADDEFTDDEREHIHDVITRQFDLDADTAKELMELADAERRRAVDLFGFTSLITEHYDEGQRMVLAELMWRVVYADGKLAKHEDYLMQKLSTLLHLRPGYLSEARTRARRHD